MTYDDYLGVDQARKLMARMQVGEAFRGYLSRRVALVAPAGLVFLLVSLACAGATVVFLGGLHSWLALPALALAPLVLVGGVYVQGLVFLSWLEGRALARALGHRPRGATKMPLPRVPWLLAVPALLLPLLLLATVSVQAALVLVAAIALVPVLYARLDRG
jgi:hypothetical protein